MWGKFAVMSATASTHAAVPQTHALTPKLRLTVALDCILWHRVCAPAVHAILRVIHKVNAVGVCSQRQQRGKHTDRGLPVVGRERQHAEVRVLGMDATAESREHRACLVAVK